MSTVVNLNQIISSIYTDQHIQFTIEEIRDMVDKTDVEIDSDDLVDIEDNLCIYLTDDDRCSDGCISEDVLENGICPFVNTGCELCSCFESFDEVIIDDD